MEYLEVVHKRHNEWLAIVKSFGFCQYAEDIVQDMYIQLTKELPIRVADKRVNPKYSGFTAEERAVDSEGNVNSTYIWLILRRCYSYAYKAESKILTTNAGEGFEFIVDSTDSEKEIGFDNYRTNLEKEINSWHHYDAMLFMTYLEGKEDKSTSLRKLAKDTKIPLSSIVNTLNNCKERLRDNVGEDYLDYCNGNYELIK